MSLKETYQIIKKKFGNDLDLEPFSIVKSVNEHRIYWKPKNVRILLLAESHVYTSIEEHDDPISYPNLQELDECPTSYVNLVYCLAYGEEDELQKRSRKRGTPDFWKIFVSCVHKNFYTEFSKILKISTPNCTQRIQNKIDVLEKLKQNGIWLLDASPVALYKDKIKPKPKIMKEIIEISWKQYTSKVIQESKPQKIMIVGKTVFDILGEELRKFDVNLDYQNQPQGIRTRNGLRESFEKYHKFCNS